jgi:hypothetical protein
MRRVGDALADLLAELLDLALSLGEHVDDLGAAPVPERLRVWGCVNSVPPATACRTRRTHVLAPNGMPLVQCPM